MTKSAQAVSAEVERIYGYDGSPCVPIAGGTFLYPSASGIATICPTAPAEKTKFWPVGDGVHQVSCIATNREQTCVVAAEKRLKVTLSVYAYPTRKLLQQVQDAAKIEVADMAFSRDGTFLAVLSGPPACSLSVYTVDSHTHRLTLFLSASEQFGHHLRHISFSPTNPEVICGSGGGYCVFWTMDITTVTLSPLEGTAAGANTRFTSHQWMPDGSVVCGTTSSGLVHFPDLAAPVGIPIIPSSASSSIVDLALAKSHLITLSPEGTIRFYSAAEATSSHTHFADTVVKSFDSYVPKASYLRMVPEHNALVVGGTTGRMEYVALPGYVGDIREDEFDLMLPKAARLQAGFGGPLVGVVHGKGTTVAVVSKSALCTIVDYNANTVCGQSHIGIEPIAVCAIGNYSAAAITSQTGCLRVMNFSDPSKPSVVFKGRFSDTQLHLVTCDPTGTYLATADSQYVFHFTVSKEGSQVTFIGCVRLSNVMGVNAIAFLPDGKGLLVSHASGDTVLMTVPSAEHFAAADNTVMTIDQSAVFVNSWRLDTPVYNLIVAAAYDDYLNILTQSMDKAGRLYLFDRTLNPERKDRESRVVKAQVVNADHEKKGTRVQIAFNKYILSSGSDGKLCLRDGSNYIKPWTPQPLTKERTEPVAIGLCHPSLRGGIASFAVAFDGSRRIVTAGVDGFLAVWNVPVTAIGAAALQNVPLKITLPIGEVPPPDADDELFFTEKATKEAAMVDSIRYQSYRESVQKRIDDLRTKLVEIRAENEASADDEKVNLEDFLVESHRKAFEKAVDGAVSDMKGDVELGNLKRDYLADLIKRECWDVMEVKLTPLVALNTPNLVVHNFHQRRADVVDASIVRKLKFLRIVEETDRRHRKVSELENIYDGPTKKDGKGEGGTGSGDAITTESATAAEGGEPLHRDPVEELTSKSILDQAVEDPSPYLYNPLLVFTKSRATIQKLLLQGRIHSLKNQFNTEFNALVDRKHTEIHHITERNTRCKLVLKELGETRDIFAPAMSAIEDPAYIFKVDESAVLADKSTDPDEKKRLAQLEVERQRWLERNGADGSSDKALKVWMDNRLDKDIRTLEINIPLPDFADETNVDKYVPPEERSDDQVRIYKDYETALQKRIDEVNLRREQLRSEFDKLQKQNLAAAKAFDDAIFALFHRRLVVSQHSTQVELSQVKLVQAVLMQEERLRVARTMEQRRKGLSDHLQRITKACAKANDVYTKISNAVAERRDAERDVERALKSTSPFNADIYGEKFIKLHNRRTKAKRKAAAEAAAQDSSPMVVTVKSLVVNPSQDPFAFIELDYQQQPSGSNPSMGNMSSMSSGSLGTFNEKPTGELAGVPEPLWEAYLKFRHDRYLADLDIQRLTAEQTEAEQALSLVQGQRDAIADAVSEAVRTFDTYLKDSIEEQYDIDDIYLMQQGQVRLDQAPVVMNFDDALMIRASVADRLTDLIKESTEEKIAIMRGRMARLKEIAMIEWEVESLIFAMRSLELQLKHLHTLRVTKQMQEFINGGGDDHNEQERKKLSVKIEHVRTTMAEKIEDRRQQMQKLRRTIKDKEVENYILQDQVGESKALVDDRRSIRDLQSSELDQMRSDKLMRDMRVTRKLEDVAKAQQAEMMTMKKNIDKLRERTFPSFAVVSKRVVGNPDQM